MAAGEHSGPGNVQEIKIIFTYNLCRRIGWLGTKATSWRNRECLLITIYFVLLTLQETVKTVWTLPSKLSHSQAALPPWQRKKSGTKVQFGCKQVSPLFDPPYHFADFDEGKKRAHRWNVLGNSTDSAEELAIWVWKPSSSQKCELSVVHPNRNSAWAKGNVMCPAAGRDSTEGHIYLLLGC